MPKRFSKINIEISNICNLQCSFCPEVVRPHGLMDPALFERIIEQVAGLTDQVCLHLMGDPLVHPKLAEFIAICARAKVPVFLVTNGVLMRELQSALLLDPIVRQVCFSLHSFADNFGDRDPSTYLDRIFAFTERAFIERPDLYINYRLWNLEPQTDASTRVPSGETHGREHNNDLLSRVEARFGVSVPRPTTGAEVKHSKSVRLKNRLYAHFDSEFVWPAMEQPVRSEAGTCYGLQSHFGILVDGTVVPCCLDKEGVIALGSVREKAIVDILKDPRAVRMLRGFQAHRLEEALCQRCDYASRFDGKNKAASAIKPRAPKIHAATIAAT